MSTKTTGKRPLRTLSAHEKLDAIRRVHDGESKASVARDIGVPESTLRGWCKNEDKISYLSRQSTPENDESSPTSEPKEKKGKVDTQPYNLSVKVSTKLNSSFSSNNTTNNKNTVVSENSIINTKPSFVINQKESVKNSNSMSERDRNRAELARLSVELGLNRPEMFLNMNGTSSLTDLTAGMNLLAQWNSILQKSQTGKVTAPADSSNSVVSSTDILSSSTPVKTQQQKSKLPKLDKVPTVDESVWYWLKNSPGLLGLNPPTPEVNSTTCTIPSTSNTSTTQSNSTPISLSNISNHLSASMPPSFDTSDHHSSWFWKWYKQFASVYSQTALNQLPDKPILYQQLTKDKDTNNSENLHLTEEKPSNKNNTKVRAVLDSLLLNNNNVAVRKQEVYSEELLTPSEALEHGEKFLKWLENCGDPSVTAMHIIQFRCLINNIKNNVETRNGDSLHKNKVRRK